MPSLWLAHLSFALLFFLLTAGIGGARKGLPFKLLLGLALGFVPIHGLSLAAYVRSFTDDVAISSLVVMGWFVASRFGLVTLTKGRLLAVLLMFALLAAVLYPATLGLSYIDPYRYGYSPRPMLLLGGVAALWFLYCRNGLGVLALALPTLAFSLGLKASTNYWDYLLDPLLALYCVGAVIVIALVHAYSTLRIRLRSLPVAPLEHPE